MKTHTIEPPRFDTAHYLEQFPELLVNGGSPFEHFLLNGDRIRRSQVPEADIGFTLATHHDLLEDPGGERWDAPLPGFARASVPDAKLLFMHIEKTAGYSLRRLIKRNYARGEVLYVYSNAAAVDRWDDMSEFARGVRKHEDGIQVVFGHFDYGIHRFFSRPRKYATFLRDPVERVVSWYCHNLRDPRSYMALALAGGLTLRRILEARELREFNNHMTRMIAGGAARRALVPSGSEAWSNDPRMLRRAIENVEESFSFVGTYRNLQDQVRELGASLGWNDAVIETGNATPGELKGAIERQLELDPGLRDLIQEANALDVALYEKFASRRSAWLK